MAALTLPQLVQLYAPLLGLLALAFWTGRLSERVTVAERMVKELREGEVAGQAVRERLATFEAHQSTQGQAIDRLERLMEGVQRQIANLMPGKGGSGIVELPGSNRV